MRTTLAFVLLASVGCGAAAPLATCGVPGVVHGCPCVGGGSGVQECSPGGAWTACVCPVAPDAGTDAATPDAAPPPPLDAPQEADAPVPDVAAEVSADATEDAAPEASAPDVATEVAAPPDAGCPVGREDCDGDPSNGCESNVREDIANCGVCEAVCALPHAVSVCSAGTCVRARCEAGFADCDIAPANGCEAALNTSANCGVCGVGCEPGWHCAAGRCVQ